MKKLTLISVLFALSINLINAQQVNDSISFKKSNLKPRESVIDSLGRQIDKNRINMDSCIFGMLLIISLLLRCFAVRFWLVFVLACSFYSIFYQNPFINRRRSVWVLCKTNFGNLAPRYRVYLLASGRQLKV